MKSYLPMQEMAQRLHAAINAATSDWIRVTVEVPYESEYAWSDDYHAPRTAHMPVDVDIQETTGPAQEGAGEDEHNYTFVMPASDAQVDVRIIYRDSIDWAFRHYGSGEGPDSLPAVPDEVLPIVKQLLG